MGILKRLPDRLYVTPQEYREIQQIVLDCCNPFSGTVNEWEMKRRIEMLLGIKLAMGCSKRLVVLWWADHIPCIAMFDRGIAEVRRSSLWIIEGAVSPEDVEHKGRGGEIHEGR